MEVLLDPVSRSTAAVAAVDLDTRSRNVSLARDIVRRAFSSKRAREARFLFKKIDSTLRGHLRAELAALAGVLRQRQPIFFCPAFPAQGRTVREGRLLLRGKASSEDLRSLLSAAGLPATSIDLRTVRGDRLAEAITDGWRIGARAFVFDALSDADLDVIARVGIRIKPRPVFVGAAGLARALARRFAPEPARRIPRAELRPILTAVGSANAVSVRQANALSRSQVPGPADLLVQIQWSRTPVASDIAFVRRLGRRLAREVPQAHYVLTGGETARAVLTARGIRTLRLLGEVLPGIPLGEAPDGTRVCTKAGGFGQDDALIRCVARLRQDMKDRR